jgi:hypothetical protein
LRYSAIAQAPAFAVIFREELNTASIQEVIVEAGGKEVQRALLKHFFYPASPACPTSKANPSSIGGELISKERWIFDDASTSNLVKIRYSAFVFRVEPRSRTFIATARFS